MSLHPAIIDAMIAAGATDQVIGAACRAARILEHSVDAQAVDAPTKIELQREATRLRQQRKRDSDRATKAQMDMFPVSIASVTATVTGVTPQRDSVTEPRDTTVSSCAHTSLSFLESKKEKEGGGGARATPMVLISPEAIKIADEVAVIAGLDPSDRLATPPGWCGAAARAETWLAHWTEETILAGARAGMAGKRDGPPESPRYFEKPIARMHLQLSAPIPLVAPEVSYDRARERQPWQSRRDNWHAARDELAAIVASYGGG